MSERSDPTDPGDTDDRVGQAFFFEVMRLYFDPEYERRLSVGRITPGTPVMAVQAVFTKDQTVIRLNSEVRGQALGRPGRPMKPGDDLRWEDFAGIESFELVPDEVDLGHVTLFRIGDNWKCYFNFLQGRSRAHALAVRAENFLKAAKNAYENGWHDVAVDNLFSACELLAKANLIVHMLQGAESKSHKSVSSAINQWGKLGNVEAEFVKLFNKLGELRQVARYDVSDVSRLEQPAEVFDVVAAQVAVVRDLCDHELKPEQRTPVRVTGILVEPEK